MDAVTAIGSQRGNILRDLCVCAAAFALILVFAVTAHPARAQIVVDPRTSIGAVPGFAGTGLFGLYTRDVGNSNNFAAQDFSQPLASFTATNLCFPDCFSGNSFNDNSGGLAAFTNGNAIITDLTGGNLPVDWNSDALLITGYVAITQPGTYDFNILTDNDSRLSIGGTFIGGVVGCCGPDNETASFSSAGLYPILFQFLEYGGASGLDLTATDPSGHCFLGCYNVDNVLLPNSLFYSDAQLQGAPAPLPGVGWPSLLVGLGTVAAVKLRKRKPLQHHI